MHPRLGANARLDAIDASLDWESVSRGLAPLRRGERGAPPYPALMMFKALLLQQWWGLSDPALEEALNDRLSFRRFVGLSADQAAPDHTALWRFREALGAARLDGTLFAEINRQFEARGLILKQGTLIDASLIAAASRPPRKPGPEELPEGASRLVRSAREPDADWTRRGAKRVFGYKVHVAVDRGSGLIRDAIVTGASRNDTCEADALIQGDEAGVWADQAYDSHARRALLKAAGKKNRICRRANRHHPLSAREKLRNALIGKVRAQVETAFAVLKRHYRRGRARCLTMGRNRTDLMLAFTAMNLRRALAIAG